MEDSKEPKEKAGGGAGQGAASPAAGKPAPAKKDVDEAKLTAAVPSRSLDRLKAALADAIEDVTYHCGVPIVRVNPGRIVQVCSFLKDDPDCRMTFLANLCGVDMIGLGRPVPRFDVVYNLFSIETRERLTLKAAAGENEEIPSVTAVWRTADWHEREAFDMFGIRFAGHPDLRRILMPDAFDAHPLRKDFPLEGREKDHGYWRQPEDEHRNTFR